MNADELRAIQAPLKDRYRADPKAGLVTLKASGALNSATIACKVETGRALAVAGLHPATGGSGAELCSGDMLLEALVACAGVTLKAVATSMGVELRSGQVVGGGRPRLSRHARRRQAGARRLHRHPAQVRTRHRRSPGSARHVVEADRALLRRAADAEALACDRDHAQAGIGGPVAERSATASQNSLISRALIREKSASPFSQRSRADCNSVESDLETRSATASAALKRAFLKNARLTTGYRARLQLAASTPDATCLSRRRTRKFARRGIRLAGRTHE